MSNTHRHALAFASAAALLLHATMATVNAENPDSAPPSEAGAPDRQAMLNKVSYFLGSDAIERFRANDVAIQPESYLEGIQDALEGRQSKYSREELEQAFMTYQMELRNEAAKKDQMKAQENVATGKAFLEKNGERPEVTTTGSGLQYEIITPGTGAKPEAADSVTVHYTGTLLDGTVFDSSVQRGEPATFGVSQVIPGWTEALQLMPEGSTWKLFIPSDLASGSRGAGPDIGPNSTLVFEVELLKVN